MAQRIPQEVTKTIHSQADIVEVIGQCAQLKKSSKNYLGLYPFHEERAPPSPVTEDKWTFHRFGCGKGGNVSIFLQKLEGLSFPETVIKVVDFGQIPLGDQRHQRILAI